MTLPVLNAGPRGLGLIPSDPEADVPFEIVPDPDNVVKADALHREYGADGRRLLIYTEGQVGMRFEMGMFGDFAPSVINAINRNHGTGLPSREANLPDVNRHKQHAFL